MVNRLYEGFYARFDTVDKAQGSMLLGADHIVGDDYEVFFKTEEGRVVAWVRNKFGAETGYFDVETSRKLQLANAREQVIRAVLSFVAYSDDPEPGVYWGEMAVFCFNPMYSNEMNAFIDRVAAKIAEGTRPIINLGNQASSKILEDPEWFPNDTMPFPQKGEGMAVLKDHQTISEKIVEQARAGNKGCYAVSILFIIVVVAAVAYGLYSLFT